MKCRWTTLFFGLVLGLLAFALSGCDGDTIRIMPLGASFTAGLSVNAGVHTFSGGYRRTLETLLDARGVDFDFVGSQTDADTIPIKRKHHEGHPGWRIDSLAESAPTWVETYQPDVVLLIAGTNDILQNHDLANAPDRLDQLVDLLLHLDPVKHVFVASILPLSDPVMNREAQAYNDAIAYKMLLRERDGEAVTFVDMYHDSGITAAELGDGIHPNPPGYDKMAQLWFNAMQSELSPWEN